MIKRYDILERIALCYEKLSRIATPEVIGKSVFGREIQAFHFGKEAKTVLFGGIHAREWITTLLLCELAEEEGAVGFDLVPCLNPDGLNLALVGTDSAPSSAREFLNGISGGDFTQWKANGRAVDLNVNFDADWGEGIKNVTDPSPSDYIGKRPHSEPETLAAVEILKRNYSLAVSYHSLGEEVYWGYEHNFRHYTEAKWYADYLGYRLKRSENSTGGLKDYYALNYRGLGLTVEVGEDAVGHPYPVERLDKLKEIHRGSLKLLVDTGEEIYERLYGGSNKGSEEGVR